jgi:hypothetical protein
MGLILCFFIPPLPPGPGRTPGTAVRGDQLPAAQIFSQCFAVSSTHGEQQTRHSGWGQSGRTNSLPAPEDV